MANPGILEDKALFAQELHKVMLPVAPVVAHMEAYEFRYCLNNITPEGGWSKVAMEPVETIENRISSMEFFESIQLKPTVGGAIVTDKSIEALTHMLFVGLVLQNYSAEWVRHWFYFDARSFNFYVHSRYMTPAIRAHLGGQPYRAFEPRQKAFELVQEVGYQDFKESNLEVDQAFIDTVLKLVKARRTPILLGLAGPTAAGKTEIVERLCAAFAAQDMHTTSMELDNFLLDRDYREEHNIGSFGRRALHFELLQRCIDDLLHGKPVLTPRYDFIGATSSHDLQGILKPEGKPVQIDAADIIFIEGNAPFLMPEIAPLVGIKVVYLTDDPVRLKRKWRRDIDYRKKYDPWYLRNRYFKEQPVMAVINYQPQLESCDIFVNTTAAEIWVTPEIRKLL